MKKTFDAYNEGNSKLIDNLCIDKKLLDDLIEL